MVMMLLEGGIVDLKTNPVIGPDANTIYEYGGNYGVRISHEFWRFGSAAMLHAGILHLLANTMLQWVIWKRFKLEGCWGTFPMMMIFTCAAVVGNLGTCLKYGGGDI